jgi:hypothetical protein
MIEKGQLMSGSLCFSVQCEHEGEKEFRGKYHQEPIKEGSFRSNVMIELFCVLLFTGNYVPGAKKDLFNSLSLSCFSNPDE